MNWLAMTLLMFMSLSGKAAEYWTSPDGVLTVTAPDSARFIQIQELPPGFIALWISHDESMKFAIIKIDVPQNTSRLIQASVEEGFADEVGGTVIRLPTRTVSGHEVWNMKGSGPAGEITQAFARHEDTVYKLMVVAPPDTSETQTVKEFIESLSFASAVLPLPNRLPVPDSKSDDLNDLSRKIGGYGGILVIGLIVYFAVRGKKKQT